MAVSQDLFDAALRNGVARERLTLVENAIDTEEFRRRASTSGKPFVVGAVGRLSEEKGFHLLIEACERLAAKGREFELRIAGEGAQRDALAAQIAASKFAPRWKLLGFQKETRALFESFDVFALSSIREGLPNVVLEAMAMEVPVLATRCGGIDAFAKHGEDAWLVEPGSVDELERGLEKLLDDADLRRRLAHNARTRVERESSFPARIAKELAVYARLTD
jgi:glycosyltransferase involved in cell wall biosynthesis